VVRSTSRRSSRIAAAARRSGIRHERRRVRAARQPLQQQPVLPHPLEQRVRRQCRHFPERGQPPPVKCVEPFADRRGAGGCARIPFAADDPAIVEERAQGANRDRCQRLGTITSQHHQPWVDDRHQTRGGLRRRDRYPNP